MSRGNHRHIIWIATLVWVALAGGVAGAATEVSFRNDVMAVISKAGCNAGACHGNANGKAGFKLSLRGQDPADDWKALTRDQQGRRVNLLEPDRSLILLKPTTQVAHEGGKRFEIGAAEFHLLRDWIAAGVPNDLATAPHLTKLRVEPAAQIMPEPTNTLQLQVHADFSDGSARDVTAMSVYDTANAPVKVNGTGLVQWEGFGETTLLVRFLDQQLPVRLAYLPARPAFAWHGPPPANYIDEQIFAKLRNFRINPSELVTDNIFVRRAFLDLLGILPTAEEARQFVADRREEKRSRLVDRLLERPEFADFWALKWSDLLRSEERTLDEKGLHNFHHWIRESLAQNKPLDRFARELLTARGSTYRNPAANFYRANRDAITRAEATAQVFLGVRLQCAQCHNHPFDRWTQADYYDWGAVFAGVNYKILENQRRDSNDAHEFKGEQIVYLSSEGVVKNPRTGQPAQARLLAETTRLEASEEEDSLVVLGQWLTKPDNPFFAQAQVNRIWFHLMGRGLVDPIDDFRATNPASHPELLQALATDLQQSGYDLHYLIRVIMNSRVYQLSSQPNDSNLEDTMNYSHALVRRLSAEQLLDCEHEVTGVTTRFNGYPIGLRAAQLPGVHSRRRAAAI